MTACIIEIEPVIGFWLGVAITLLGVYVARIVARENES